VEKTAGHATAVRGSWPVAARAIAAYAMGGFACDAFDRGAGVRLRG
jgi:hypothetical protein